MTSLIRDTAETLRASIETARESGADIPWLARFPRKCCNFAANLLLLELSDAGVGKLHRVIGGVGEEGDDDTIPHVWVRAGDIDVDVCADQHGHQSVVAECNSQWHSSLEDVKPFLPQHDNPDGIADVEVARLRSLYQDVLKKLAEYR